MATVSKVLNDASGAQIAPATRERVRVAADALGYRPSAIARALIRKQIDTIGIILPQGNVSPLRSTFFAGLLDGILQAAVQHGQHTMLFTGHVWMDAERSLPAYRDGRCDGFLLLYQRDLDRIVPALLDANVPVVLLNETYDDPRLAAVDVDNVAGGRTATEYLIALGHRRIGMVYGTLFFDFARGRREGYFQALAAAGLTPDPYCVGDRYTNEALWQNAGEHVGLLLDLPPNQRPTALFCANDEIAARALQVLAERGVRVPEEMSVVGFNDDLTATRQTPPLTTLQQPFEELGEAAVSLLLEQIREPGARGRKILLPTRLVTRASACPPPPTAENITQRSQLS
jgi:DNA-binding LacI/PurR family transcriptional regulator